MNLIFLQKLKKALKSSHPLEAIGEVIAEYDELHTLATWKKNILISGKNLKKHEKEIQRISNLLEEGGYYLTYCKDDLDKEIRDYFRNLK